MFHEVKNGFFTYCFIFVFLSVSQTLERTDFSWVLRIDLKSFYDNVSQMCKSKTQDKLISFIPL